MKKLDEILKRKSFGERTRAAGRKPAAGRQKTALCWQNASPSGCSVRLSTEQRRLSGRTTPSIRQVKDNDYDRMIKGTCQGKAEESLELAYFFTACLHTLEVTSMEII